jgi:hypothetical protein
MEFLWNNQIRQLQGVNDESFKPYQSKNYQKRFARTMPEMLGFMVGNWKQVIMEFFWKNQIRRLQGVNDESFKPHQSKNYQKRFSRTMPFLQYAYRSVLRSHTKKCILTCRKSCKSSQNYWRGLLVYRPSEKFITTSPSKKESNQSMPDHTVICTIKKRRSRNKSMVC